MEFQWPAICVLLSLGVVNVKAEPEDGLIARLNVLTIHVVDTNTHEAVFQFLTDFLRLPVDYYPEQHGERRYAAVYAGNLFIEPCGPYRGTRYPVTNFSALFYGLNCTSRTRGIEHQLGRLSLLNKQVHPGTFHIQDDVIGHGMYLAISGEQDKAHNDRETVLRSKFKDAQREELGLEYVKEIWLAYSNPDELRKWAGLLGRSSKTEDGVWDLDEKQRFRLVKGQVSQVKGVRAIVFKVRSLEKAVRYLKARNAYGRRVGDLVQLDQAKSNGLTIFFSGD